MASCVSRMPCVAITIFKTELWAGEKCTLVVGPLCSARIKCLFCQGGYRNRVSYLPYSCPCRLLSLHKSSTLKVFLFPAWLVAALQHLCVQCRTIDSTLYGKSRAYPHPWSVEKRQRVLAAGGARSKARNSSYIIIISIPYKPVTLPVQCGPQHKGIFFTCQRLALKWKCKNVSKSVNPSNGSK